ncbi:MAG: inositol monophosphatase [Bacteroidetes bacterium GWE2_41_25]|nr:MAG: inositol monophosphatase [Bacteroidetes bacterium GWA2_40_15]OFX89757.1 MAG: inositol monophosphatase [Bacteroidetes bacterium GWC2_40_22]OFY00615.1 MAG: inositol monophosphatase [Bacteroidetes bacterium GWE2_41_25]OFY57927.1 MAG: inositol monophosphatase [Bacteroidetes bacterium GWF2_41_9]HAM09613.1 inositol monophosphatase [Bacteroidales bacterium]
MTELKRLIKEVEKIAAETAEFISGEAAGFDISRTESKGLNDFVSYVDKGSEKMLVEKLSVILPEAGFKTEEGTSLKSGARYCWVIDPLDGTTNFLHGLKLYAISIGLLEDNEPVAGVIHVVGGNEVYTAWKGGGAWLNGKRIHVSDAKKLSDSLIATGLPYSDFRRLDAYMNLLSWLCRNTQGIRRMGSAAIDIAYVACGRFEVFYEYGLHPWDIAAGVIILREAGGNISDFSGGERNLNGDEIVAANRNVYPEILETVSKFMNKSF